MSYRDIAVWVAVMGGSLLLTANAFLSSRHAYAHWAKIVYTFSSLAALSWVILDYLISHSFQVSRESHSLLVGFQDMLAGTVIGFTVSVLIARPYTRIPRE